MAGLKYGLLCAVLLGFATARGQSISYQQADSTSYSLYLSGNWPQLITYGEQAIKEGNDFPLLRLRMGYAQFTLGNYAAAIDQYKEVLKRDSHDQTANYYSYLANLYLNRDDAAAYHVSFLDDSTFAARPSAYKLVSASAEGSVKFSKNIFRGNATFTRIGLVNQLGYHLQLEESFAYFRQSIGFQRREKFINNSVNEFEYYGKLNYTLNKSLSLIGAYHYLNTKYKEETYHNNVGLVGLKYNTGYVSLQADANIGKITGTAFQQYNAQVGYYPLGNLNLYFISKGSLLHQDGAKFVFNQTVGTKVFKGFWVEGNGTFGVLNNYLDADALYVYNAIDITKFKTGATGYYQLGTHVLLYANYTFEHKTDFYLNSTYNQYSVTGGLTWKF